jgi:hypothetical protein
VLTQWLPQGISEDGGVMRPVWILGEGGCKWEGVDMAVASAHHVISAWASREEPW